MGTKDEEMSKDIKELCSEMITYGHLDSAKTLINLLLRLLEFPQEEGAMVDIYDFSSVPYEDFERAHEKLCKMEEKIRSLFEEVSYWETPGRFKSLMWAYESVHQLRQDYTPIRFP